MKRADDGFCLSVAACTKRRMQRVGVRAVLADPPIHTLESAEARIEREIRRVLYIHGLCTDGCGRAHSPGRPRCEVCHHWPQVVRILLQA